MRLNRIMELDSFLSSPRWEILRMIIQKPSSPMEIAKELETTNSFISQQLKLLEAAGIVKRKRTGAVEKGKPRTLFSISQESVYLVPLAKGIYKKKFLPLSRENKVVLKIWTLEDPKLHPILEKFFWKIQEYLDDIDAIVVHLESFSLKVYIISKDSTLLQKINKVQSGKGKVPFQILASDTSLRKLESEGLFPVYDPQGIFENDDVLKGGSEKNE